MKIKCVFSDLDWTLLNRDSRISEANKKAIEELKSRGICFVPATGRAFRSLPQELFELSGVDHCITSNGASVFDLRTGEAVIKNVLPPDVCERFFGVLSSKGRLGIEVYYRGKAYCSEEFYNDPFIFNQKRVDYVKATRTPVSDLEGFLNERKDEIDALCIISPEGRLDELFETAKTEFPNVYITRSDGLYIELSSKKSGKHNGLRAVCDMMGFSTSECIAFGDNDNDVEMLETAGFGVCVANGTPGCIAAADMVTEGTNDEDGFAEGIRKVLGGIN